MEKMRNVLDHTLEILSGVSFLAMVVLTCWQVFTRYLFKKSVVLVRGAGVLYVRVDGPFRGVPGDW